MEGRRVNRQNQKTNPLFILFICLIAAVFVLLIVSIVLGVRLRSARKELAAAKEQIEELTETIEDLQAADTRPSFGSGTFEPSGSNAPAPQGSSATGGAVANASWLDLDSISGVSVKPSSLLDKYYAYYTTAGVNLRSGPGTNYDKITVVELGEKIDVAAREGNWSFVRAGSRYGWINSDYLSTTQPTASARTSSSRSEATAGSLRR